MTKISYAGYRFPPEIIQHAIWLYDRFVGALDDIERKPLGAATATHPTRLLGVRDMLGDVRILLRGLKLALAGLESEDDEPALAIGSVVEDKLEAAITALDEICLAERAAA